MKFFSSLALSTIFIAGAFAQSVDIGAPADGTTVSAGSNITVEIDKPPTLTGSTEVAIIIGFLSCSGFASGCPPPSEILGTILYNGPYDPEFHSTGGGVNDRPYQNFTVTIPSSVSPGPAQLGVAHVALVGAGQYPFLETLNITLNVVSVKRGEGIPPFDISWAPESGDTTISFPSDT
ncbi:hypothetical protein MSAN_00213500 [Mycena sanguinolenta]|uniref:Uncharacterized protein n=1 Tax=Mycena sanguinolenta TaxID=230812 RepID=A0A8H6ZF70_9AGAR|nr:hypothetical protein MSAN_00213500 [Mycena sanguinolenta]